MNLNMADRFMIKLPTGHNLTSILRAINDEHLVHFALLISCVIIVGSGTDAYHIL